MYRFPSFFDEHTVFLPKFNLDRILGNKLGSTSFSKKKTLGQQAKRRSLEKIIGRCGWRAYVIIF